MPSPPRTNRTCNRPQLWRSSLPYKPNPCTGPNGYVQTHLDKAPYTAMVINSVEVGGKGLLGGWGELQASAQPADPAVWPDSELPCAMLHSCQCCTAAGVTIEAAPV